MGSQRFTPEQIIATQARLKELLNALTFAGLIAIIGQDSPKPEPE